MGNLKHYGGSLTDSWHAEQVMIQKNITQRMSELGIRFILPSFAGIICNSLFLYTCLLNLHKFNFLN